MTKFHIDQGIEGNLPTSGMAEEGHLYVTSDKGNAYFAPSDDGNLVPINRSPYYLTCATAAGTAIKSATMPDGEPLPSTLRAGIFVVVKFAASNTATSPSLKITDGFGRIYGPIAIKKYGTTAVGNNASVSWSANEAVAFLYDGEYFLMLNHIPLLATALVDGLMSSSDFKKINAQSITATASAKADLNDYKTVGTYITSGGHNGSSVQQNTLNTPTGSAGAFMLVVLRTSSDNSITLRKQIYIQADGDVWSREYNSSTWSTWSKWDFSSQVQSDWNQVNTTSADFIKNKPAIVMGAGASSIQEGNNTSAVGSYSHAQNNGTKALGHNSHAEGANTVAVGLYSHVEGSGTATPISGVSGGAGTSTTIYSTTADHGLSVGDVVEYEGTYATVSNIVNPRLFMVSDTLGELSSATINLVKGVAHKRGSHVEGRECIATGEYAHAEGYGTEAGASCAHAEGYDTEAGANYTHAEGYGTKAIGLYAHSEGRDTEASGAWSHAEGRNTVAGGSYAHAEGRNTEAGNHSHSEGYYTKAQCLSYGAHAEGANTETHNDCEHAEGRFNKSNIVANSSWGDAGNTIHSIGIGTANNNRKNAVEVMQNGDIYIIGLGNYDGKTIQGKTKLQTLIASLAIDTNVVHKLGSLAETITGNKTFTGNVLVRDNSLTMATDSQSKHPINISVEPYYDDGAEGVGVLGFDDGVDGNVILRYLHDPIESCDAATKNYVDNIVGDIETLLAAI